ncbi:MAG: FCD domain-containing protein [Proteobacteria bacterium]|nr:FCD domain-containing protein [Pseudomonadota bacterium]
MSEITRPTSTKLTVNESVYLALKADIVDCRLLPNERLRFEELKQRYRAAFSSLREALSRLISEGLVVMEQHRGARVADMKDKDFLDLLHIRRIIEAEALRNAIANGGDEWEAGLVAAFHMYERALGQSRRGQDPADRIRRHNAFHDALISGCTSERTLSLRAMLYVQAERYLMLSFRSPPPPPEAVLQEHESIMRAALARKVDLSVALIQQHLDGAAQRVMPIAATLERMSRAKALSQTKGK